MKDPPILPSEITDEAELAEHQSRRKFLKRGALTVAGAFSKLLDFCRPAFARRVTIQCPDFAKGLRKKGSRTLSDGRPSLRWLPILLKPCTRSGQ